MTSTDPANQFTIFGMDGPAALGQLRHALTMLGTILVTVSVLPQTDMGPLVDSVMGIAGGVLTIAQFVWSYFQKKGQQQAIVVASATAATQASRGTPASLSASRGAVASGATDDTARAAAVHAESL